MRRNSYENKIMYLVLQQVFIVTMAVSFFTYEHSVNYNPHNHQIWYLIVALFCFVLSNVFLLAYSRTEAVLAAKARNPVIVDKIWVEIPFVCGVFVMATTLFYLQSINVKGFSLPGLVITVGTIVYLADTVLLIVYGSIFRRAIRKSLGKTSLLYLGWQTLANYEAGKGIREMSRKSQEQARLRETLELIADGNIDMHLDESLFHGQEKEMAKAINRISEGLQEAVEARTRDERMRVELITNVSHDIKTPLTSIVNYVELLKREKLQNEKAEKYIHILEQKSQRLKNLTEDLVEASKISSGNIQLEKQMIDFLELLYQTGGEFNERFEKNNLTIITKMPENPVMIEADGRYLYRAIENLYINAAKYAKEDTKVHVELAVIKKQAFFTIKNISKTHITIQKERYLDLTERFVRGEFSRTTEGSGLGLSIAKSLTEMMGGKFEIRVEGELFVAQMAFPVVNGR